MKTILLLVTMALLLLPVQPAYAHVLITDETKSKGAILHVMSDDDPIAGQISSFYLDTQDQTINDKVSKAIVTVADTNGEQTQIPMKISGSLAMANYTFPIQGTYQLTFTTVTHGKTYIFKQSQRVSRGTVTSALDVPTYPWADMLSTGSASGLVIIVVIIFNRRKDIARQSII